MSSKIRDNLIAEGKEAGIAFLGKATSEAWKGLSDSERKKYDDMAAKDKARYLGECAVRDEEALAEQEARRAKNAITATDTRMRGTTLQSAEALALKESAPKRAPRQMSEKFIEKRDEARAKKATEEKNIQDGHDDIKKKKSQQAEARLQFLLKQSDLFAHFSGKETETTTSSSSSKSKEAMSPEGRRRSLASSSSVDDMQEAIAADEQMVRTDYLSVQPASITGGQMKPYQLEGLNWMISLQNNGLNGILADEMGLGKTLQSISLLAAMKQQQDISGPHLIVVPKSTLSNWMKEFKRWCPSLRPISFHGTKEDRAEFVQEKLKPHAKPHERDWDVCVTTYEICSLEKTALVKFAWKYLVIDEAHRMKNEASQLAITLRMMKVEHRLLLTGTPLQNNLHEMWALLNFLLPDVFSSSEQFDEWFNLDVDDAEAKERMIGQLHKLLRPFMLRRIKKDADKELPPKSETILFTGMSAEQKILYKNILLRDIDAVNGAVTSKSEGSRTAILNIVMQLRKCCNHPYLFPGVEDRTKDPLAPHLWETCGKMVLLDKLLGRLKSRGHRVLIFSQMTKMLDILEDYLFGRQYNYCRIDGNTNYEDREDRITAFNAPNSELFIFLLSTRAGGLGINLQTADTVIIYDSDWNPQADLQAQDRAHRIGQKKPVQVFRLVTEDTVEVKVIERAQQKLKLDAMVVQQGRLQDQEKKLSKDELLETIRFGADKIFRSKESDISTDDIDAILDASKKRSEEMGTKLTLADKGDMLDFKLDGGMGAQEFEGIDYSAAAKKQQAENAFLPMGMFIDPGKRERKTVATYSDSMKSMVEEANLDKKPKMPRHLRLPRMEDWQFFDKDRLTVLQNMEITMFDEMIEKGLTLVPGQISKFSILSPELHAEKNLLIEAAFGDMTRVEFNNFLRACAKYGRNDLFKISKELNQSIQEVKQYSTAFWAKGPTNFAASDWDRYTKQIEKGEKKLEEISRLTDATEKLIRRFEDPWEQLTFKHTGTQGRIFNSLEDRYLLCLTQLHGYGAWDRIRNSIRRCEKFRFDYFIQSCSSDALGKRCEQLMKAAERELVELERKGGASMISSFNNANIHEMNVKKVSILSKQINDEARRLAAAKIELKTGKVPTSTAITSYLKGNAILNPAEKALAAAKEAAGAAAAEAASSLLSSITAATKKTKATGKAAAEPKAKKVKAEGDSEGKGGGALLKPIPEELLPALYAMVTQMRSSSLPLIVQAFVQAHPGVSKRQTDIKLKEITVKVPLYALDPTSTSKMTVVVLSDNAPTDFQIKATGGGDSDKKVKAEKAPNKRKAEDANEVDKKKAKGGPKKMTAFGLFRKDNRDEVLKMFEDLPDGDEKNNTMKEQYISMWGKITPKQEEALKTRADAYNANLEKKASAQSSNPSSPSGTSTFH